jgi:probable F420-dependent oxidoreductase
MSSEATPVRLGKVGVFAGQWGVTAERAAGIEKLGYGALWIGGSPDADLAIVETALSGSEHLAVATGIVNVWSADAAQVADSYHRIEQAYPGRFLLGVGVGHPEANAPYRAPYQALVDYLDVLDEKGVPRNRMALAALGPRVLALSADRTAGAHPYLVTPEHSAQARATLGAGPVLAPEQRVVLAADPARARELGRASVTPYLRLTNYTSNLQRLGFTADDVASPGSDRLVDALVVSGDDAEIRRRFEDHHRAGADHVAVQLIAEPEADLDAGFARLAEVLELPAPASR